MRIESIEIKNFRQYESVNIFFPKSKNTDLHIILGSNGVGKTNILNAITWCLYDKELHLGASDAALPILNMGIAESLKEKGIRNAEVSVILQMSGEGDTNKVKFVRKARFVINDDNIFLQSSLLSIHEYNGSTWEIYETPESTLSIINKYVPETINDYIFFDGEHLEHYFQAGQRGNIKSGINTLTQADIIQNAGRAFKRYIKEELDSKLANSKDSDVAQKQLNVQELEEQIEDAESTIQEIKNQIQICNEEIDAAESKLKNHEILPQKIKEQNELEAEISVLKEQKDKKWQEIKLFTRASYQLFALYPAIKGYYDYIKQQEKEGKLPPRIDKDLLEEIIHGGKCLICDRELDSHAAKFLEDVRNRMEISSNVSAELNRSMSAMDDFMSKMRSFKTEKDRLFSELAVFTDQIEKKEGKLQEVNIYINNVPDTESIIRAIADRNSYKENKETQLYNLGSEEARLKSIKEKKKAAETELQKAIEKDSDLNTIKELKNYCENCIRILSEIYDEILDETRTEMQKLTFETFNKLIWKKGTFKEVIINEDYEFKLINKYGHQALGSCSAAERVLLALSFTLALQSTSKHDSLLFIDTPIGRVDEENRFNFISTLLNIAEDKQVILTFTPTEYDENVRNLLAGKFSTRTSLTMSDDITKANQ